MKKLIFILLLSIICSTVSAKPHPWKQRHQNRIFQMHLQHSHSEGLAMNQSFAPKSQAILPKFRNR